MSESTARDTELSETGCQKKEAWWFGALTDSVEPMRNNEKSARRELLPDDLLDLLVVLRINSRGGLVQDEYLATPKQSTGQAHQLSLAGRQVGSASEIEKLFQ